MNMSSGIIGNSQRGNTQAKKAFITDAANKNVSAYDRFKPVYLQSKSKAGGAPQVKMEAERHLFGDIESTNNAGDLAFDGKGYMLVTTKDGVTGLVRSFSGRPKTTGLNYEDPSGNKLRVWYLDAEGNVPVDSSSFESTKPMSLAGLASSPQATTAITIEANLSQDQKLFDGPGGLVDLARFDAAAANTGTSIITPGDNSLGSLRMGDQLTLKPGGATGTEYVFEFGGFSVSRAASSSSPLLGATSPTDEFTRRPQNQVPAANELKAGQVLRVTVGGNGGTNFDFTVSMEHDKTEKGEFYSLSSLSNAMREVSNGELITSVGRDGRLYVSSKDPNAEISFQEQNGLGGNRSLVHELGLSNVGPNVSNTHKRFNTLQGLRDSITNQPQLRAQYLTGKTVKFGTERATVDVDINGKSSQKRLITHAFVGGLSGDGTNDTNARNIIRVLSPNHGLKQGDHVRIDDPGDKFGNRHNDGIYRVNSVTGDEFTFAAVDVAVAFGTAVDVGQEILNWGIATPTTTWQKVEGAFNKNDTAIQSTGNTTVGAPAANGYSDITLNLTGGNNNNSTHRKYAMQNDDMVFISGSTVLKPGYYRVTNTAGGPPVTSITVQAKVAGFAAGAAADDDILTSVAAAGPLADANAKIMKVSQNDGGLEVYPLELTAGSKDVRISKSNLGSNHQYSVGDVIIFRNMIRNKLSYQNVEINANTPYVVKSTDANTIVFEADGNAAAASALVGYYNNHTGNNAAPIIAAVDNANDSNRLGATAEIQVVSKTFKALGMTTTKEDFQNGTHLATYDPLSSTKNMASGSVKPHKQHVISVYDSFGQKHAIHLSYLRLSNTEWAVEVHVPQNEDGTFDVSDPMPIRNGVIEFDGNGRLKRVPGSIQSTAFNWTNDAAPSTIKFNYGALFGDGATEGEVGLTQNAGDYVETRLNPNGHKAGGIVKVEFEDDGKVRVYYSNGVSEIKFQVPTVQVADVNSLDRSRGVFLPSEAKSGPGILTKAGVNGAGTFVPSALEASKVGDEVLMEISEIGYQEMTMAKIQGKDDEVRKFALQTM